MTKRGKKYRKALNNIKTNEMYSPREAVELAKENSTANFDETMEIHIRMGIDPRKADQQVRSSVLLPHGLGKSVRVLAFVEGEGARIAEQAGADFISDQETIQKIKDGWSDFDAAIAVPEMMGTVGSLGKILGPRGLMPNPKLGSVTLELDKVIKSIKAGQVEFRAEKAGIIHAGLGRVSFGENDILLNIASFIESVKKARPTGTKGQYLKKISIGSTMGPSLKIDLSSIDEASK